MCDSATGTDFAGRCNYALVGPTQLRLLGINSESGWALPRVRSQGLQLSANAASVAQLVEGVKQGQAEFTVCATCRWTWARPQAKAKAAGHGAVVAPTTEADRKKVLNQTG